MTLLFGTNDGHQMQCTLITKVIGEAGARLQTRDISLGPSDTVFLDEQRGMLLAAGSSDKARSGQRATNWMCG